MIAEYESGSRPAAFDSPRQYGISQQHKHLPEMAKISGLSNLPLFCPIVADFYSGMLVTVPLFAKALNPMEIAVFGNEERILLCSRFDNLGKGASGAAVQCINLMTGADETTGLEL